MIRARVVAWGAGLGVNSRVPVSIGVFLQARPCMSLLALDPAGPASNLSGEKISPTGKPASSRALRSKFSRLPGPSPCSGRKR